MSNIEKTFENLQPEEVVSRYYEVLNQGDLENMKRLMTEKSYLMALDSFGLKLAFKDLSFKQLLETIREDEDSLQQVEEVLSKDLLLRDGSFDIKIKSVEENGTHRKIVDYTENGKVKNLYFSKEKEGWKINYYAGRKVN